MHTETKSECVQLATQSINPAFVLELSVELLCGEQWLGRFGMLDASVCVYECRGFPAKRCVSPVSLLVTAQTLSHGFFSQSICTIITGTLTS